MKRLSLKRKTIDNKSICTDETRLFAKEDDKLRTSFPIAAAQEKGEQVELTNKLTSPKSVDVKLSPFPAFIEDPELEYTKQVQHETNEPDSKLTPFPAMCEWCRRRRPPPDAVVFNFEDQTSDGNGRISLEKICDEKLNKLPVSDQTLQKKVSSPTADANVPQYDKNPRSNNLDMKNSDTYIKRRKSADRTDSSDKKFKLNRSSSSKDKIDVTATREQQIGRAENQASETNIRASNSSYTREKAKDRLIENQNVSESNAKNRKLEQSLNRNTSSREQMSVQPREDSASEDYIIQGTSKESLASNNTAVSQCPMCGLAFDMRSSVMDIDSHLAACLSAADDDIMW